MASILTPAGAPMPERLRTIYQEIAALIRTADPEAMAVEELVLQSQCHDCALGGPGARGGSVWPPPRRVSPIYRVQAERGQAGPGRLRRSGQAANPGDATHHAGIGGDSPARRCCRCSRRRGVSPSQYAAAQADDRRAVDGLDALGQAAREGTTALSTSNTANAMPGDVASWSPRTRKTCVLCSSSPWVGPMR